MIEPKRSKIFGNASFTAKNAVVFTCLCSTQISKPLIFGRHENFLTPTVGVNLFFQIEGRADDDAFQDEKRFLIKSIRDLKEPERPQS